MPDIILTTLNAKYIHAAFGLRYLLANLGDLRACTRLLEFDLQTRPLDIAESILAHRPRIIGLGVYVWNARESLEVVSLLKRIAPNITIILGGPEVSHEADDQPICGLADHVITGEADLAFPALCRQLLAGQTPNARVHHAPLPDLAAVALPYGLYSDDDLAHRIVYVEASRGCPFTCEFCLSSLDVPVRQFPLEPFLAGMQRLLQRGLRHFKFVDRTFNLNLRVSRSVLEFFLERMCADLFLHFEMVPDRLPPELLELIRRFPPRCLQFEIGIQTFNPEVAERIRRRQDCSRTETNLRLLRQETDAHLHADLIVGLPGESLESFADGFDRLLALNPHEIQIGLLKRLRGTPIARHDREWLMVYRPDAPYDLLCNRLLDFGTVQRLRRFAHTWDRVSNSGRFVETAPLLWIRQPSPFHAFLECSDWLHHTTGSLHQMSFERLTLRLHEFLTRVRHLPPTTVLEHLARDYRRLGQRDLPPELRTPSQQPGRASSSRPRSSRRQQRHRGGNDQSDRTAGAAP
jgi:radical SAM superfamily enzyme YgiQ (UPF0313 family)